MTLKEGFPMFNSKSGKLSSNTLTGAVIGIVVLVLLLKIGASLIPDVQDAAESNTDQYECEGFSCEWLNNGTLLSGAYYCYTNDDANVTCAGGQPVPTPLESIFDSNGIITLLVMVFILIIIVVGALKSGKK